MRESIVMHDGAAARLPRFFQGKLHDYLAFVADVESERKQ